MWDYTKPIINYRRFLKPKVYKIIDRKLQNELEKIYKDYESEMV